jgi:hypothetical protein
VSSSIAVQDEALSEVNVKTVSTGGIQGSFATIGLMGIPDLMSTDAVGDAAGRIDLLDDCDFSVPGA